MKRRGEREQLGEGQRLRWREEVEIKRERGYRVKRDVRGREEGRKRVLGCGSVEEEAGVEVRRKDRWLAGIGREVGRIGRE